MKIICVGRNYVEHIEELNNEKPKEPIIFFKPTVSLNKSTDFSLPEFSNDIHHEIEIIFEIGRKNEKSFNHRNNRSRWIVSCRISTGKRL